MYEWSVARQVSYLGHISNFFQKRQRGQLLTYTIIPSTDEGRALGGHQQFCKSEIIKFIIISWIWNHGTVQEAEQNV